jgi:hypothetical protein
LALASKMGCTHNDGYSSGNVLDGTDRRYLDADL